MIYVGPDWVCAPDKSRLKNRIYITFNLHWSTSHYGNNQRGLSLTTACRGQHVRICIATQQKISRT